MSKPKNDPAAKPKKAYRAPVIEYYGAVRTLTQTLGMTSGLADGMANNKTQP